MLLGCTPNQRTGALSSVCFQGIFCMLPMKDCKVLTGGTAILNYTQRKWKQHTNNTHITYIKWWSLFNILCQNTDKGAADKLKGQAKTKDFDLMKICNRYNLLKQLKLKALLVARASKLSPWCWNACWLLTVKKWVFNCSDMHSSSFKFKYYT